MFLPLPPLAKTRLQVNFALLFFLLFLGFFSFKAEALEVPPAPDTYVSDRAEILSPETEARLEVALAKFEEATSNQVVIATFPSLEGEALEDFSIRLAEKWKPGQKGKDNGVVLLIFRDDRKVRIEVGYGLEGALPDALAGQIINNVMVPEFQAGKYDEGILKGTRAILEAIQGEYKGTGATAATQGASSGDSALIFILLLIAFILFLLDTIRYSVYLFGHKGYQNRYRWIEWWIRFSILLAVLGFLLRMLFYASLMRGGGYSGGRSGGGFSGGGGSFGGGGASGRW